MTPSNVRLIAGREIRTRLRTKAFRLSTLLVSGLLAFGVLLPTILDGDDASVTSEAAILVVVGAPDPAVRAAVELVGASSGRSFTIESVPDRASAVRRLDAAADGDTEPAVAALVPGEGVLAPGAESFTGPGVEAALAATIAEASALVEAGLDPAAIGPTLAAPPLPVTYLGSEGGDAGPRYALANLGAIFIYATLLMYGAWMVNAIIEEKANRVVELLLAAVRPSDLMAGKVLGLGVVGIAQTIAIFVPALLVGVLTDSVAVPSGAGGAVLTILGWWILGFLLYSVLCAAAGALVSRPEETQVVLTPVTLLLVGSYFTAFPALSEPHGTVAVVASLVPFSAPVTMVTRMLVASVPVWQIATAAAGVLATAWLATLLAARIYAGGLLKVGRRVKLRQAWRGASG